MDKHEQEQRAQEQRRVMKIVVGLLYALEESGSSADDIYEVLIFCLCQFMNHAGKTPQQTIETFGHMLLRISLNREPDIQA